MEQALRQRPSLHCSQTNDSTFFQRHMHLEIQTWKTAIIFWSVGLQRSKMIATLARVLFTRHFTVGFFFYLYVFVKIKEIFSCTPSCSHFFAALKKKEILVTCPNSERPRERTCPHRVSPSDWQLSLCPAAGVSPGGSPTPAGPGSHLQAIQHNSISTSSASAGDVGHDLRPGH